MKHIAIIGATGTTGKEVVNLALKANYKVIIIARDPSRIKLQENNLLTVAGDVTNIDSLIEAFKNVYAVISCFGPANGRNPGNLMSVGTANIVQACEKSGVSRLVFMSGILQTTGSELTFLNRLGLNLIKLFFKEVYRDKTIAETAIQESSLNWVIIRAVGLSNSEPKHKYKAGAQLRVSPFNPLSYSDLALCLLDALKEDKWARQVINVGKS
jgi:putative NADH-flavin reductase